MRKVATVFGGAGFIGRQVVQRLAREDWVVRVAARHPPGEAYLASMGRPGQFAPALPKKPVSQGMARPGWSFWTTPTL